MVRSIMELSNDRLTDTAATKDSVPESQGFFASLRKTLKNRPDSEHEMSINRLVFNFATFGYIIISYLSSNVDQTLFLV